MAAKGLIRSLIDLKALHEVIVPLSGILLGMSIKETLLTRRTADPVLGFKGITLPFQ